MIGIHVYQREAFGYCPYPRAWYVSYKNGPSIWGSLFILRFPPTAVLMEWPWPANSAWAQVNPIRHNAVIAHGTIMGFAFAFLFPLGAILIRTASFRGLVVRQPSVFVRPLRNHFRPPDTL